jgi:sulfur-oxidizing protein SoxY
MSAEHNKQRRKILKGAISVSTLALVASSGFLLPKQVLAHWPSSAFTAETVEQALLAILGEAEEIVDDRISFKVGAPPSYAVNGAAVPVEIHSDLANLEQLIIVVEKNPFPLAMSLELTPDVALPFKTMIKVAEDSIIMAIVKADGKLYRVTREISVDIGGCA